MHDVGTCITGFSSRITRARGPTSRPLAVAGQGACDRVGARVQHWVSRSWGSRRPPGADDFEIRTSSPIRPRNGRRFSRGKVTPSSAVPLQIGMLKRPGDVDAFETVPPPVLRHLQTTRSPPERTSLRAFYQRRSTVTRPSNLGDQLLTSSVDGAAPAALHRQSRHEALRRSPSITSDALRNSGCTHGGC